MVWYPILRLDFLPVLQYNNYAHYGGNTKGGNMEVEVIKANNPFDESSKVRKVEIGRASCRERV